MTFWGLYYSCSIWGPERGHDWPRATQQVNPGPNHSTLLLPTLPSRGQLFGHLFYRHPGISSVANTLSSLPQENLC